VQEVLNALQASYLIAQIIFSIAVVLILWFAWRDFRRLVDHLAPGSQDMGYEEYEEEEEEMPEEELEGDMDRWDEGSDDIPDRVK